MARLVLELKQLRYAVAAADHGSFRRAAEALHLRQSTLSRRIRQIEEELGVALFERSRAGVRPTIAGAEFIRTARRVVKDVNMLSATAKAAGRGEIGRLIVGLHTSLSAGNLRATLVEYVQRFPQVEIRAVEGSRAHLFSGLQNGSIDVAIVTGDPIARKGKAMSLWSERILVALPEHHLLAGNESVYWTDLRSETFLLGRRDPGPDIHDLLLVKLASPGDRPKVMQHDASRENIKSLVGAGFGVSLMPDACIGASYAGVVYREVRDGNGPSRVGYAAHWEANNSNPALACFLKLLEERYPLFSGSN
jgi:DNA-binding transcriptional LysR family regulator